MSSAIQQDESIPAPLRQPHISAEIIREEIWRPANRRNDWRVFAVVGREGSGKSLTCASILKACDPTFGIGQTHFEPVPFLEDIGREDVDVGKAVMGDEVGVAFGNRTWHDREQVEANQYLQTARDGNRIVGLTIPRLEELDVQLEGRLHHLLEVEKTNDNHWVEVNWKRLDPSRDGRNKVYKKHPKKRIKERTVKVTHVRIGPPPREYVNDYLPKKKEFKGELKGRVVNKYEEAQENGDNGSVDLDDIVVDIKDNGVEEYIGEHSANGRTFISKDLIKHDYDLTHGEASTVQKLLKRDDEVAI